MCIQLIMGNPFSELRDHTVLPATRYLAMTLLRSATYSYDLVTSKLPNCKYSD